MADAMTGPLVSGGRVMAMDGLAGKVRDGIGIVCLRACVRARVRVCSHFRHEAPRFPVAGR
jgi:hypothetical protein